MNIQGVVGIHTLALFSFQFCISFILVNSQTTNLIRLNKPLEQLKAKTKLHRNLYKWLLRITCRMLGR